jgi:hypothetical protein
MADVKPIPEDYPQLVPYLCVDGANAAIDFYRTVFGGVERMRMPEPDGRLGHAEVEIGSAVIMLSDEFPALGIRAPNTIGGTPVTLSLYVEVSTKSLPEPSTPAPPQCARSRISSTAIAPASSRTRSDTGGASPPTSWISLRRTWPNAAQRRRATECPPALQCRRQGAAGAGR